jgi:regulatory protein
VVERRLRVGDILSEAEVAALVEAAERRDTVDAALHYLSYRPRSRAEVERHLRRRGFGLPHIQAAVERCTELGYIDDAAFAVAFVRERIRLRPRGRARLLSELLRLGVDREVAARAIDDGFLEMEVGEAELLREVAGKRWRALEALETPTARRRHTAYLARRGFGLAEIRAVVDELAASHD